MKEFARTKMGSTQSPRRGAQKMGFLGIIFFRDYAAVISFRLRLFAVIRT